VIITTGGTVSTVNIRESLPLLPAASVARTTNVCAVGEAGERLRRRADRERAAIEAAVDRGGGARGGER
jgi:hypothetical protein